MYVLLLRLHHAELCVIHVTHKYLQKHEEKYIHTPVDNEVGAFQEMPTLPNETKENLLSPWWFFKLAARANCSYSASESHCNAWCFFCNCSEREHFHKGRCSPRKGNKALLPPALFNTIKGFWIALVGNFVEAILRKVEMFLDLVLL